MTARGLARRAFAALRPTAIARELAEIDPSRDPLAEPIPLLFVVVFAAFAAFVIYLLKHFEYEPGQDIPYHTFCTTVAAEWGKPGSPYTARYEPIHPTEANTLMYVVGAFIAKWAGPVRAFRILRGYYFVGLPLAVAYSLRRIGRSPWGAILAFPLCYMQAYTMGFANFQFAAPSFVLAILAYYLFLQSPTWRRGLWAALLFCVVFLSHAHVYLWLGALVLFLSVHGAARDFLRPDQGLWRNFIEVCKKLGYAVAAGAPSLYLFYRWYERTYGAGHAIARDHVQLWGQPHFGAKWNDISVKLNLGPIAGGSITKDPDDLYFLVAVAAILFVALVLSRLEKPRGTSIFELCGVLTIFSYFVLPDSLADQQIALRAFDLAAWLIPFMVIPVSPKTSLVARWSLIAMIVVYAGKRLTMIRDELEWFNEDEMAGFDALVAATPHENLTIAYVPMFSRSRYFVSDPLGQVQALVAARKGLEAPLYTTNEDSSLPVRYKKGPPVPVLLMINDGDWGTRPHVWEYDLILTRNWKPVGFQIEHVTDHATLIASSGLWQLWRTKR